MKKEIAKLINFLGTEPELPIHFLTLNTFHPFDTDLKPRFEISEKIKHLSLKLFSKDYGKLAQIYSAMLVTLNSCMKVSKFS